MMKRLLCATVAAGVLALGMGGSAEAKSLDFKQLKSNCHNGQWGAGCGHAIEKLAPKVKKKKKKIKKSKIKKPKIKKPKKKIKKPKVKLPKVKQPKVKKPKVKLPKVTQPKIKKPKVKLPKVVVPKVKNPKVKGPKLAVPKIKIAPPPIIVVPGLKTGPAPKIIVDQGVILNPKGGFVTADDLRKRLAGELVGKPPVVAPVPERGAKPVEVIDASRLVNTGRLIDLAASQLQADEVTRRNLVDVAAALDLSDVPVKVFDQTLTADDIRRSSEDFATAVLQKRPVKTTGPAVVDFTKVDLNAIIASDEKVVSNSGDRVLVEKNGEFRVLRNDDVLLNRPGADVQVFQYKDGSTRNVMSYQDGTQVQTIRAADGRVVRRASIQPDGREVILFDDTQAAEQVQVNTLPPMTGPKLVAYRNDGSDMTQALVEQASIEAGRTFSLAQVRDVDAIRQLVPEISIDAIKFASNSAAIRPEEAEELAALGNAILAIIQQDPTEMFLVEGHTDARGGEGYNLALSDRRAESVALALVEYFGVPPENLILQGYGEDNLLIDTLAAEEANRRAAVRRITPLLNGSIQETL